MKADFEPYSLLREDRATVLAACSRCFHPDVRPELERTLPTILLRALRSYDLELGSVLVRVSDQLGLPRTRQSQLAVSFLRAQQRLRPEIPDAGRGGVGVEAQPLQDREAVLGSADPEVADPASDGPPGT
jgi:hypothetical protein